MRIIDVIDHTNVAPDELAYREPQAGSGDWRMGSQVIVGESQAAVFVRSGEVLDKLGPGRHTLSTANLPILSGLIGLATSGRTPFTADLYFVNLKDMPQVGWGTNPPIVMETPGRGMGVVLLQTFGVIDIGVDDAVRFVKQYAVGRPVLRLNDIKDRIQAILVGEIAELILKAEVQSIPDANRLLGDLEGAMLARVNEKFAALGMRIKAFEANPFKAKEDVSLDELRNYITAEAYERYANERRFGIAETAAGNPGVGGSLAGAGVGLGVGQSLGQTLNPDQTEVQRRMMEQQMQMQQMMMNMMANQMGQNQGQQPAQPAQPAQAAPANPQTKEEIQALLDALDNRLASGELSEAAYNRLVEKWQKRLDEMG
ncbi:MAG: SPFH domain-containing protein [Chloroflexi bacterium]|nr:SPFH domain-containing protein [Chloroflexota bacterium]